MSEKECGGGEGVCRDFLRNVCTRGDRCKFHHPAGEQMVDQPSTGAKLQDKMEFCHDFQNGRCHRVSCRFIHCPSEVELEFLNSGYLPPNVRDQVIRKGVAVDFPAVNGGIPICKDFLKGTCTRDARCRFRHCNAMEYDMEMNSYQTRRRPFGYGPYDEEEMYERRGGPPKRRCLTDMAGPPELVGAPPQDHPHAFLIQEENHQLRGKVGELEKRVSDLTATNEFLLDQNAQLRMGGKSGVGGGMGGVGGGAPSHHGVGGGAPSHHGVGGGAPSHHGVGGGAPPVSMHQPQQGFLMQ